MKSLVRAKAPGSFGDVAAASRSSRRSGGLRAVKHVEQVGTSLAVDRLVERDADVPSPKSRRLMRALLARRRDPPVARRPASTAGCRRRRVG
jgi:hypothetical protein